jgi:hypothetical protein
MGVEAEAQKRLDDLRVDMNARFADVFAVLNANLTVINGRFDDVHARIGSVEGRLGSVEGRLGSLESRIIVLETKLDAGFAEVRQRLDGMPTASSMNRWFVFASILSTILTGGLVTVMGVLMSRLS